MPKYGEEHKGEEEGATTEDATSSKREGCYDRRKKEKKKTKRRSGMRKPHQISNSRQKDKTRYEMTWQNISRSRCANSVTARK